MPGLAAIELVLLALPWSLLLDTPIGRHAGWSLMTVIVVGGVVTNAVALYALGTVLERWWHARR